VEPTPTKRSDRAEIQEVKVGPILIPQKSYHNGSIHWWMHLGIQQQDRCGVYSKGTSGQIRSRQYRGYKQIPGSEVRKAKWWVNIDVQAAIDQTNTGGAGFQWKDKRKHPAIASKILHEDIEGEHMESKWAYASVIGWLNSWRSPQDLIWHMQCTNSPGSQPTPRQAMNGSPSHMQTSDGDKRLKGSSSNPMSRTWNSTGSVTRIFVGTGRQIQPN